LSSSNCFINNSTPSSSSSNNNDNNNNTTIRDQIWPSLPSHPRPSRIPLYHPTFTSFLNMPTLIQPRTSPGRNRGLLNRIHTRQYQLPVLSPLIYLSTLRSALATRSRVCFSILPIRRPRKFSSRRARGRCRDLYPPKRILTSWRMKARAKTTILGDGDRRRV
jgi:hypothetical protein